NSQARNNVDQGKTIFDRVKTWSQGQGLGQVNLFFYPMTKNSNTVSLFQKKNLKQLDCVAKRVDPCFNPKFETGSELFQIFALPLFATAVGCCNPDLKQVDSVSKR
ncbi:hypothetical protein MKW94_008024, partial [Papaver nudicaule]|nr:hypothetical protein [Papaver nudicaule]